MFVMLSSVCSSQSRADMNRDPCTEKWRINHPTLGFGEDDNGFFQVPCPRTQRTLAVMISDGMGWDHVSVSLPSRCPTWEEMCYVKDLFFGKDEWVLQYHPSALDYKNCHPYCLHLWRPQNMEIPKPNSLMVAP